MSVSGGRSIAIGQRRKERTLVVEAEQQRRHARNSLPAQPALAVDRRCAIFPHQLERLVMPAKLGDRLGIGA